MPATANGAFGALRDSLITLRDLLPVLAEESGPPTGDVADWLERLGHNALPALSFEQATLVVAVCGGGSTGKSTLFNSLAGQELSLAAFRAGLTQRIVLAAHPDTIAGPAAAGALFHRLDQAPQAWTAAERAGQPGPPLFASSRNVPPHLVLVDTPDFDTGDGGELANRRRALPILRTAEVLIYLFTNTVYNNRSNTAFMSKLVGGIGGRPTILVYRVSRVADDDLAIEHCRHVAQQLYAGADANGWPSEVVGVYRIHESDAVARGEHAPELLPLTAITAGRSLPRLLQELDAAAIKRWVLADDLSRITIGAREQYRLVRRQAELAALYRQGLETALRASALQGLGSFPAREALQLTAQLFAQTSPGHVRVLRTIGRAVGAPLRAVRAFGRQIGRWIDSAPVEANDPQEVLAHDLLLAANGLRNDLLAGQLVVQTQASDVLAHRAQALAQQLGESQHSPAVERLARGLVNVHIPEPELLASERAALTAQDWSEVTDRLSASARALAGMPRDIERELIDAATSFRQEMNWRQRLRETFFASLAVVPPILGVTYTLLTADPVAGSGLVFHIEGILGLNDLWALVSIPASAGLDEQDRHQLQAMLQPAFEVWLSRRVAGLSQALADSICPQLVRRLESATAPDDPRFAQVEGALTQLESAP